jgi:hypothetical protein
MRYGKAIIHGIHIRIYFVFITSFLFVFDSYNWQRVFSKVYVYAKLKERVKGQERPRLKEKERVKEKAKVKAKVMEKAMKKRMAKVKVLRKKWGVGEIRITLEMVRRFRTI